MATQERALFEFDDNDTNLMPAMPLQVITSAPPYMHDLKITLEFDRKCRALEDLFNNLQSHINALELKLSERKG